MLKETITIIGCGNMGSAMISGLISNGFNSKNLLLIEVDDNKRKEIEDNYNIKSLKTIDSNLKTYSTIIVAVKPNNIKEVLEDVNKNTSTESLIISCAAGIPIKFMENQFDKEMPIVRIMPNICALVGDAAVAVCFNKKVRDKQKEAARDIINTIGTAIEVEEDKMDVVTGLSGSGPAFVFLMIEALADGGVLMGLEMDKALQLAIQTVYGTSSLLKKSGMHPAIAREKVSSPGGTTIEGLLSLEEGGFKALIMKAVKSATEKSKSLGLINDK